MASNASARTAATLSEELTKILSPKPISEAKLIESVGRVFVHELVRYTDLMETPFYEMPPSIDIPYHNGAYMIDHKVNEFGTLQPEPHD